MTSSMTPSTVQWSTSSWITLNSNVNGITFSTSSYIISAGAGVSVGTTAATYITLPAAYSFGQSTEYNDDVSRKFWNESKNDIKAVLDKFEEGTVYEFYTRKAKFWYFNKAYRASAFSNTRIECSQFDDIVGDVVVVLVTNVRIYEDGEYTALDLKFLHNGKEYWLDICETPETFMSVANLFIPMR